MLKFSIIVPTLNLESYITKCLFSLKNQTILQEKFEVIVIDDGSTDCTLKIVSNYKGIKNYKFLTGPKKIGPGGPGLARNMGLRAAQGKYIIFLDGDDYLDSKALEIIQNSIEDDPDAVMYNWCISDDPFKTPRKRDFSNITTDKEIFIKNYLGMSVSGDVIYTAVKKEIFDINNLFFAQHQHEDMPMIFKTLYLSNTIKKLKNEVIYYKSNRDRSIVNSIGFQYIDGYLKSWPEIIRFLMKFDNKSHTKYIIYYLRGINGLVYTLLKRCIGISGENYLSIKRDMYKRVIKNISRDKLLKGIKYDTFPRITNKDIVAHNFYELMTSNKLSNEIITEFESSNFMTKQFLK
jgi:glycosyltransferase involved in cell wall biosynthesis